MNITFCFFYIFAVFFLVPGPALAHVPFEGLSDFYNGILHPVFVPAHVLLLIAAGLYLGKHGSKNSGGFNGIYSLYDCGTGCCGFLARRGSRISSFGGIGNFGYFVSANFRVPTPLCLIVAALAGFIIGLDSAQDVLTGKQKYFH